MERNRNTLPMGAGGFSRSKADGRVPFPEQIIRLLLLILAASYCWLLLS